MCICCAIYVNKTELHIFLRCAVLDCICDKLSSRLHGSLCSFLHALYSHWIVWYICRNLGNSFHRVMTPVFFVVAVRIWGLEDRAKRFESLLSDSCSFCQFAPFYNKYIIITVGGWVQWKRLIDREYIHRNSKWTLEPN